MTRAIDTDDFVGRSRCRSKLRGDESGQRGDVRARLAHGQSQQGRGLGRARAPAKSRLPAGTGRLSRDRSKCGSRRAAAVSAAAMCIGPLSTLTTNAARRISQISSWSEVRLRRSVTLAQRESSASAAAGDDDAAWRERAAEGGDVFDAQRFSRAARERVQEDERFAQRRSRRARCRRVSGHSSGGAVSMPSVGDERAGSDRRRACNRGRRRSRVEKAARLPAHRRGR